MKHRTDYHRTPEAENHKKLTYINPTALRKAKIVYNFGLSECSRVKMNGYTARKIALPIFFFATPFNGSLFFTDILCYPESKFLSCVVLFYVPGKQLWSCRDGQLT